MVGKLNTSVQADASEGMDDVWLNRHSICDPTGNVLGYETRAYNGIIGAMSEDAYASVDTSGILRLLSENLDTLSGSAWALVSLPWTAIRDEQYRLLSKQRVVIGIEAAPAGGQCVHSLAKLRASGYRLAVSGENENLHPLIGLADMVKWTMPEEGIRALRVRGECLLHGNSKSLIDGVHTHEDFESCRQMGFELFAGHFFSKPRAISKSVPVTRFNMMRLLSVLQSPDVRLDELEQIVQFDVSLTYKLLRFINSAYVGLHHEVTSIKHAVGLVGIDWIRKWASLLLFASIEHKPRELIVTAATRARMCELLAGSYRDERQAVSFTVGLLSMLDALLDCPMAEAVHGLALSQEITDALLHGIGPLGTILRAVIAYEQSDWKRHVLLRFRPGQLRQAYLDSLEWTQTVMSGLMI